MAKVADYISKNIVRINKDLKIGLIPLSVMQNYEIYNLYLATTYEKVKQKRYEIVANRCKCSKSTVRRAISEMEKTT